MTGHVTRVLDLIVRGLRQGIRYVETVPSLDVKRGVHLTMAGLLLLTNAGYAAPIVAAPFTALLAAARHGVDGGTATYLQPPPVPSNGEAVVVVSALPKNHIGRTAPALDGLGIPRSALRAYHAAAENSNATDPRCGVSVALLAAIGRVESGHARGGNVDESGTTRQPILGPQLNGSPGVAAIADTDNGLYDGDTSWDRAVGPMQFIPSTWARWAADGNDDGVASPHNIYDATVAAANYLCAGERDLRQTADLHAAILSYNHSTEYLRVVLAWLNVYSGQAVAIPDVRMGSAETVSRTSSEDNGKRETVQAAPAPQRHQGQTGNARPGPVQAAGASRRQPGNPQQPVGTDGPVPPKPKPEPDPAKAVKDTAERLSSAELVEQTLGLEP